MADASITFRVHFFLTKTKTVLMQQTLRRWDHWLPLGILSSSLFFLAMLISPKASATHFRGGTLTWQPAGGNSVSFSMNTSWRRGFAWPSGGTWTGANPPVGATVRIGTFNFGDGQTVNVNATVNSIDVAGDIINTTWTTTKAYAAPGTYIVNGLNSTSRVCPDRTITPTCNGSAYNLQTIVTAGGTNRPPVSSFPTVINVPVNATTVTFTVPATDADGDPMTFRLSGTGQPTGASDVTHESGLTNQNATGLNLASDGTITMNTTGLNANFQYSFQLMIEDHNAATSAVKSKTPVDFLIRMVPASSPPVFTSPTITSYTIPIGTTQSFTVTAITNDAARTVTLNPVSVPLGSTMSPSLPTSGSVGGSVSSTFSWTPASDQAGTYVITFVAQNELGLQSFKSVNITVPCALNANTSVTPATCAGISNGAVSTTPINYSSLANLSYGWTGPNSFTSSNKDISNLTAGDYTLRIDDNGSGCAAIIPVTVNNTLTITPTASNNGPICEGNTLNLSGSGASNLSWTGPNGFSSTSASPSIANATPAASGTYTLTATDAATGCNATISTNAVVNPRPATPTVTASGPTTFCTGSSVTLNASRTPSGTTSYLIAGGSASGSPVNCDCPAGSVAVGYKGRTGSWLDQFQFACKQLNNDGTLGSTVAYTNSNGVSGGGGPVSDILFTGNNVMVGLDVNAIAVGGGPYFYGITGYGQTTSYVAGSGANGTGYASLATMSGNGIGGGSTSHLGTLIVPDGNVVTGMSSYNNNTYSKGVALHYNTLAAVTGADLTWSNAGATTGPSLVVSAGGSYTVTVTNAYGCTATSAATVVTVNTPPQLTCPANVQASTDAGVCGANVTYPSATVTGTPTPDVTYSKASGSNFNVGTTQITVSAGNVCGTTSCTFDVVVTDNELPTVVTQPVTLHLDATGHASLSPEQIDNGSSDNCTIATYSVSKNSFDCSNLGANTVTLTVTDNKPNQASGTATVTVVDDINPTVVAASPATALTSDNTPGDCGANVAVADATTADNCTVSKLTWTMSGATTDNSPATGINQVGTHLFNTGTTTVSYTVTDQSGNTGTASTTVIVTDDENPTIVPAAAVATTTSSDGAGNCSAVKAIANASANDNCTVSKLTWVMTGATSDASAGTGINQVGSHVFNIGTTTITYTVTDASDHTATASTTVTVTDNENPTVAASAAITGTTSNDGAGNCTTLKTIPDATTNDNCSVSKLTWTMTGATMDASPATGINQVSSHIFNIGTTTINYTVADPAGNMGTSSTTVTITDDENPTVAASTPVIAGTSDDGAGNCTVVKTIANAATSDNCAVSKLTWTMTGATSDASPLSGINQVGSHSFNIGTTTITYSVSDPSGNTATSATTITVSDNENPTVSAGTSVAATTSDDGTGNCTVVKAITAATKGDNCSVSKLTWTMTGATVDNSPATGINQVGSHVFNIGTTTITYTVTDGSGNSAMSSMNVVVTDIEQPIITRAVTTPLAYCNGQTTNNSRTFTATATDNCTLSKLTWAITGTGTATPSASPATGINTNATANFTVGTYTITWTASDASGNSSSATNVLTINPLPVASYTASNADAFCNAVELSGNSTISGSTYAWYYNNTVQSNTSLLRLKVSNSDGVYSLKVTSPAGCVSAPVNYTFQKQSLASMYVLIGMKEVDLKQNNDVYGGSVGVTSSYGEAEFDKYCSVASPGAFVKAHDIDVQSNVTIPTKIYSPAVVTFPTMLLNTANTSSLSSYTMTTNGTVTGNKRDLTINSGKTVTITGNVFRKIRVNHDAIVTFTASDISLEELELEQGVTLLFSGNTNFRVTDEVTIDKECSVNPTGKKLTFYVKDPGSSNHNHDCYSNWSSWHGGNHTDEKFIVDGKGTNVIANVYMPGGKLRVHGNGWNCNWNSNESCTMVGLFIAEEIEGDGKNISWYSYDCNGSNSHREAPATTSTIEEAANYNVLVYPNPTSGQFTVQFANVNEAASVRVTDIQGRIVAQRSIAPQEMPSASFDLRGKSAGIYLVEVQQGQSIYRNKVVVK